MLKQLKRRVSTWLESEAEDLAGISLEYSYQDLAAATGSFCAENKLGAGAAGAVYRGFLRGGTEVAVKVLKATPGGLNGFEDELRVLSRFRHPNLVTLLGWGQNDEDDGTKYLVYELMLGGDVERRLHRSRKCVEPFPWQQRLRVALDAACGLSYMVNSQPKAFHRDIKPPNILLDVNGTAKMADFGLASTIKKMGQGHLTVEDISGTPGYADPKYIQSGKVTEQSEVYSFGTVLLELMLNERPALSGPQGDILYPLIQIVQPAAPGAFERIMGRLDPSAEWQMPLVEEFAQLSLGCVSGRPEKRPLFEDIVDTLRRLCQASGAGGGGQAPSRNATSQQQQRLPAGPEKPPQPQQPQPPQPPRGCGSGAPPAPPPPPAGSPAHARCQSSPRGGNGGGGSTSPRGFDRGFHGVPPPPAPPQRSAAPYQPEAARHDHSARSQLAEVVLECVHADGVELARLPLGFRAVAHGVDGRFSLTIGRQHQPEFFEALVPKRERLQCISRAHFELCWDPRDASRPMLRKLSGNPLFVNETPVEQSGAVPVGDGATIGFSGMSDSDPCFLVLRAFLRTRGAVSTEGPHPAIAVARNRAGDWRTPAAQSPQNEIAGADKQAQHRQASAAAVLECIHSQGGEPWRLGPESRAVPLCEDEILEVGRQHQLGFFENLLKVEPQWLGYISRTHLSVRLSRGKLDGDERLTPPRGGMRPMLKVENLSANAVLVNGRQLTKGQSECISEGGTLGFVAKPTSGAETEFLRFTLRRARSNVQR